MLDKVKSLRRGASSYLVGADAMRLTRSCRSAVAMGLVTLGCGRAQPDLTRPQFAPRPDQAHPLDTAEAQAGAETGAARQHGSPPETEAPASPIVGIEWSWIRFVDPIAGGIDVPEPHRYTMLFDTDGVAHVRADCNEGSGSYMLDRNELAVRILEISDANCGEGSLSDEFVDNVNSAARFHFVEGRLVLSLRWETGTMEFAPGSPRPPSEDASARPPARLGESGP